LAVEYTILIRQYYQAAKTRASYEYIDGPAGWLSDNLHNLDGLEDYHWTAPELMVRVYWQPRSSMWQRSSCAPAVHPQRCSASVANTNYLVDVPSSISKAGSRSSWWLPTLANASRSKNWPLGTGAWEYAYLGGKLWISEQWTPSLWPSDVGGVPGIGGIGCGFGYLCRSGGGAPGTLRLQCACTLFLVPF